MNSDAAGGGTARRHAPARRGYSRWLASGAYLALELATMARYRRSAAGHELERLFASRADPWDFAAPAQQRRFGDALALLEQGTRTSAAATGHSATLARALEIGCAEGAFTELLADRCDSVLAVDISAQALARARRRVDWGGRVRFQRWDLWRSPPALLGAPFDLVVVMEVLDYAGGPWDVHRARERLARLVRPGGHVLVGNSLQSPFHETSWWGRLLLRGGTSINEAVAAHPDLRVVDAVTGPFYVQTLLRRAA